MQVMALALRTRLFAWLLPHVPGGTIAGASPERIAQMQRGMLRDTPLTRVVIGHPLPGVAITDSEVAGADGALRARRYHPDGDRADLPLVIHLHGGGWVRRDLIAMDWLLSRVARAVPAVVVMVDHRVAPTHRFPAAVEDAVAALRWVGDHGRQYGGDPTRLAVMGDSSGANLATVAARLLRDRGGPPLASQVLLYPPVDLTGDVRSLPDGSEAPILSHEAQRTFGSLYLGAADPSDPRASPLLAADLTGLPPTLLQVGDHDPLCDDVRRYAQALRRAGVPTRATIYLDAIHGFLSFSGVVPAARQAAWEVVDELRRHLAG